ncbi:hypothetical protein KR49_06875 [Synechococcus sp. KORDI-49]|nr:hypothetical protein KR49_06875 [Synechococcus sp. KORDI-49]
MKLTMKNRKEEIYLAYQKQQQLIDENNEQMKVLICLLCLFVGYIFVMV